MQSAGPSPAPFTWRHRRTTPGRLVARGFGAAQRRPVDRWPDVGARCATFPGCHGWETPPAHAIVLPIHGWNGQPTVGVIVLAATSPAPGRGRYASLPRSGRCSHRTADLQRGRGRYEAPARRAELLAELDRAKTAFFSEREPRVPDAARPCCSDPLEDALRAADEAPAPASANGSRSPPQRGFGSSSSSTPAGLLAHRGGPHPGRLRAGGPGGLTVELASVSGRPSSGPGSASWWTAPRCRSVPIDIGRCGRRSSSTCSPTP